MQDLKTIFSSSINSQVSNSREYKLASILVVIYGNKPNIIMTKKPNYMKFHAGEISFPGGKIDNITDSDLLHTALRETMEEIGLGINRKQVIGQLDSVTTMKSRFLILPFIAIIDTIPTLVANSEVEKIFHIPMEILLETMAIDSDPSHNLAQEMYTFKYQDQIIWGASARILKQIHDVILNY